jgi:hypothetical protein
VTSKRVAAELRAWAARCAREDRGRGRLRQLGHPYPGGDLCPRDVVCGLASLLRWLERHSSVDNEWSPDERAAIEWLRAWVDAGAMMIGR